MPSIKSTSFNPFGEDGYAYAPDVDDGYHVTNDRISGWVKITLIFIFVLLIVTLIGNIVFTSNQRNTAVQNIGEFNVQSGELHRMMTSDKAVSDFSELSTNEETPDEVKQLAEGVTTMTDYLREKNYTPLSEDMDNATASEIVIPYYAICDAVSMMGGYQNMDTAEYGSQCVTFSSVSMEMMGSIKSFNMLNSGVPGMLNPFSGDNLPDVTA